jgi:hypothetical protein
MGGQTFFFVGTQPFTQSVIQVGETMTGNYESKSFGAELNLTYALSPAILLYGGPRWIRITEEFRLHHPFGNDNYIWAAENDLFGVHAGAQLDVLKLASPSYGGPFGINTKIGLGVFRNSTDASFTERIDPPFVPVGPSFASDSAVSAMVEGSIEASYAFSPNVKLSAGYKLLWINNVSTAIGQLAATGNYAVTPPLTVAREDVLYHGFTGRLSIQY